MKLEYIVSNFETEEYWRSADAQTCQVNEMHQLAVYPENVGH